ncbi:MAG: class I SAM-dependent methyltransferase [Pseudomonadota bacterium]
MSDNSAQLLINPRLWRPLRVQKDKKSLPFRVVRAVLYYSGILKVAHYTRAWGSFLRSANFDEAGFIKQDCGLCGFPRLIRLYESDSGIRCPRCLGGTTAMSLAAVINREVPETASKRVYELSTRGPLYAYLSDRFDHVTGSEFWPEVQPGDWQDGFQCQNVEHLTYADESFDLLTSTEVFEHVVDDLQGYREARRVLVPGGTMIFSVPLLLDQDTIERAVMRDGQIHHLTEPEYHDDAIRGPNKVLAFRTYGLDIVDRLLEAGFREAVIDRSSLGVFGGYGRAIIIARA